MVGVILKHAESALILGIHHTAIATPNLDRLVRFYCDHLGFRKVDESAWPLGSEESDAIMNLRGSSGSFALLAAHNTCLEIIQFHTAQGQPSDPNRSVNNSGITHICLGVRDLDAEYARLVAAGMRFHCPPIKPQDTKHQGARATYGRDPDGNVIELLEFIGHTPFNVRAHGIEWNRFTSEV